MHFVKVPARAMQFRATPTFMAILMRLCFLQFKYEKRGRSGSPFFMPDRDLAEMVHCSTFSVWRAKKFWRDNGIIRFWVGEKNRTYYVVVFDLPKKSKYPLKPNTLERRAKKRSGKAVQLKDLIPPRFLPPEGSSDPAPQV